MTDPRAAAVEAAAGRIFLLRAPNRNVESRTLAKAAITAYESRMAEAGWVMVPREATDEMADAGRRAGIPAVLIDSISGRERMELKARYAAMVRAAMLGRDDPPRADGEG